MTTTRIPAGPVKTWALTEDGPVPGRAFTAVRVRCPLGCGIHWHRLPAEPRPDGHLRRPRCGAAYLVLVAADGRVAA